MRGDGNNATNNDNSNNFSNNLASDRSRNNVKQIALPRSPPFWVTFAAGGVSGTVGAIITNPLEVVKTRMQSSLFHSPISTASASLPKSQHSPLLSQRQNVTLHFSSAGNSPVAMATATTSSPTLRLATPLRLAWSHVAGTLQALRAIYTQEGLTALWRGMGPTIVGVMPSRAIYFSTYSSVKHLLAGLNHNGDINNVMGGESSWIHLSSAVAAGIVTSTATNPIWMVKTRMQLQSKDASSTLTYRNSFDCVRTIARTEGINGLYKGLTASYLGTLEGTIQWVLYEKLKRSVAHRRQQQELQSQLDLQKNNPQATTTHVSSSALTWTDFLLTAASAKLVAAIIAYPHEVIRTRLREGSGQYRGLMTTAIRIFREEGVTAFYGGMTAHLMRVVPNSAIMFFCYEFLVHGYSRWAQA